MASEIKVDTVSEKTSANGVTIDGLNIKDSKIVTANSIDSDVYIDGSIDTAHLAADAVTGAKIADDAINSEHYADGSIDTAHIADNQITLAKLAGGTDGNIISFDASGDPVAIATGSDGQVLTSTGAGSAPAFEALPASGKILQVVGMRIATQVQNNTETYADTGVTLNITPSATSSKIIVMCTINGIIKMAGNTSSGLILQLLRDTTSLVGGLYTGYDGVDVGRYMSSIAVNHLDSPSSTSALTYKMQFKNNVGAEGVIVQANGVSYSSIVLMEVGA